MRSMKEKKWDLCLIGGILLAGCLILLLALFLSKKGDFVQVKVSGEVVETYPLSRNGSYEIAGVTGKNLLIIQDGEAWIKNASCPDKLCVKMGHISKSGQSVICLPNEITIEIITEEDNKSASSVDIVAG